MAAALGARSALPSHFTGEEARANPIVVSFEKELGYFTSAVKKLGKKSTTAEHKQKM